MADATVQHIQLQLALISNLKRKTYTFEREDGKWRVTNGESNRALFLEESLDSLNKQLAAYIMGLNRV